ncbi:MAG: cytochrome c oxidase subunit I [Gemmatimonadota bacterium]
MATAATAPAHVHSGYHEPTGVWSWLTTVDHKRIGALYLYTALAWFAVGGLEAVMIRIQLQGPNGRFISADTYNQLFTMHGTTMVFLVIMPMSAAFFNLLIPLQIGARDVAFPRLNAFSYWVYLFGSLFMNASWLIGAAPDGGWFGYTPLTTYQYSSGLNIDFWLLGLQILGVSSLAAAFNFITTIINMRAPGMNLMRMPVFTWMAFVVQFLLVLAFPVITIALVFLQFDRFFGTQFYQAAAGADPLLWQHLFWIFGHPEVYILILPAFGLVSEVLPTFSRKPLFGYAVMVYSAILIAFLGFGVWAHHMFAVGMGPVADTLFALTTMLIGIPTGVKIFNWIFTMWGGDIRFTTPMKFAIALVGLFTIGGISGVMHASPPADLQQTDTYFIVAHFHYVLFGGSMMGLWAGVYYYYPKLTGKMMSEKLGSWHFWLTFIAMNLTFMPMHWSGLLGMPRRTWVYDAGQGLEIWNLVSSLGAYLQAVAVILGFWNMWRSRKAGAVAGANPWGAGTLEWSTPSPPPEYNYAVIPTVTSRYPMWDGGMQATESSPKSAKELGIPMPNPTIKPLFVALFMTLMLASMLLMHKGMPTAAVAGIITFAVLMTLSLYSWLLTPLEDEH